ncbi:tyrosine-type recombinase/integrase [Inhella sp.]|uniref:tyrosine-type recombinase/integrase n=1 Tax=Inhella sp. TaxID=1921806 RepID=UPI0035AEC144
MARRKAGEPIDLTKPHSLTAGLISDLACPAGKQQAFLRDADCKGLRVRVTEAGAKSFVFESKVNGKTLRRTIGEATGNPPPWSIEAARIEANRLRVLVDRKQDPRELDKEAEREKVRRAAEAEAAQAAAAALAVTVGEVWPVYMEHGKPRKKAAWKPRYRSDLLKAASPGGEPLKRGKGVTKPGHLAALMPLTLASIDQDTIRDWYLSESNRAPIQAARAVAMFSGFLSWCATRREYRALVNKEAARASDLNDVLPASRSRTDALEAEQLAAWFAGIDKLRNRHAAAYLVALLLTGARREEMAGLRWADVDFQNRRMTIADKVEATRVIPLAPYLASLLASLPRVVLADGEQNPFVFASAVTQKGANKGRSRSASGRIAEPRAYHADVLTEAGLPHVSIHGLRRSFALMGEAAGVPAGAIAQVMGHRPSAVSEHYKPRPIGVLGEYLAKVETFILERAGIAFDAQAAMQRGLRVVSVA